MLVGGAVVAEDLVVAIFGAEYRDAALPFAVLMLSTAVVLVSVNVTQVLLAIGEERHFAWSVAAGALINVVLNLVLIPVAGATGAAVATVAAEVVVFAMNTGRLVRRLGRPELETRRLAGVVAATAVMAVVVVLMPAGVSVWVRLAVAAAAYAVGAVAFGAVRRSDAALLRGARGGAQDA
jgi:O-antigen/teichoic acid export membrane protein